MRHLYRCPMRWADLDLLGHVNNVTYVDYLQEARVDMLRMHADVRGGEELAEGVVVVRHDLEFLAPLELSTAPLTVECWVSEVRAASFTMGYEILGAGEDRTVHLRASTLLSPFVFAEERPRRITADEREAVRALAGPSPVESTPLPRTPATPGHAFDLWVRWSDVDAYGHVNNVAYLEYFQEARIRYVSGLPEAGDGQWTRWVLASMAVEYKRPVLYRAEPYDVRTWVTRVGSRSMTLLSEVRDPGTDGGTVLARARAVLVAFDAETQRSTDMNPRQRERLLAEVTS